MKARISFRSLHKLLTSRIIFYAFLKAKMSEVWEQQWQQGARGLHRNAERLALRPMRRGLPNRVNQLEAAALDSELIDMLLDQMKRVFALARPGLLESINPEMQAIFRTVIYAFSIWINKQTPGNMFMNLICVNAHVPAPPYTPSMQKKGVQGAQTDSLRPLTRKQRLLHALFFVILPWLMARGERIMARRQWGARPSGDWRRSFWLAVERSQAAVQVLSTANLLLFLRFGRYRGVGERLMGMDLVPLDATVTRGLNLDYMNLVLAFQTIEEVLTSVRPMLAYNAAALTGAAATARTTLYRACRTFSRSTRRLLRTALTSALGVPHPTQHASAFPYLRDEEQASSLDTAHHAGGHAAAAAAEEQGCSVCGADPPNSTHVSDCPHLFCYVCLRTLQAQAKCPAASCPRCDSTLLSCQRLPLLPPPLPPLPPLS